MDKRMKILSPINELEEVVPLMDAGADEFYCGVTMGDYRTSCTRRENSKLDSITLEELEKLVPIVRKRNKEIFLALNRLHYSSGEWQELLKNIDRIKKLNLTGLILANLDLIKLLRGSGFKLAASSFFETKNREAVRFLKEFGIQRIILDRQIDLSDIEICLQFPKLEFETFVMTGACRSLANYCQGILPVSGKNPHLCQNKFLAMNNGKLSKKEREIIGERLSMPKSDCCCGLCALWEFKKNNIFSLKIVGRGFPLETKTRNVRMVKEALEALEKSISPEQYRAEAKKIFKKHFGFCCDENFCYYPQLN